MGFCGILWDSVGFCGILGEPGASFDGFSGILEDFLSILGNFWAFLGILRDP